MAFWNRHNTTPLLLDLGTDGVKMMQAGRSGSNLRVVACGRRRFPDGMEGDSERQREFAAQAIREMCRRDGFLGRTVISSLPCGPLGVKNIRLPQMPEHDTRRAVLEEANERFGYSVVPDRLRWFVAGQVRQGNEVRNEVIMMAVSKEDLDAHMQLLSDASLRPLHIDPEPIALFRAFTRFLKRQSDEQAVTVLVDLGRGSTRVVVARGQKVVFIKAIDIGGDRLTDAVAKQLSISNAEAAELRLRIIRDSFECLRDDPAGQPKDRDNVQWTLHDALRGEVESLAREVALCLRYCSVTFRGLRPKQVVLLGGEAYDPAIRALLGENLGIECVVGQPLRGLDLSGVEFQTDRRATLAEWTVCAGMSLRHPAISQPPKGGAHAGHRLSA